MRPIFVIAIFILPLMGQEAAKPADAKPAESPVPATESWLTGSIDLGYRWRTDVGGSIEAYRSIVNLGSGPKLLGLDLTLIAPKHGFDQLHVRASSWGDDPYSTFHLDARKAKLYSFSADYRDFAYFNILPSFADPLLARGITLNEQAFETHKHFANFNLEFLPGNWIIPYVAFDRVSSSGTGTSVFVASGNEYPVPNTLRDSTSLYRGGLRFELRRFHATLEEGGTTYKDDQRLFQGAGSTNYGNLGVQRLDLTSQLASYGIRGSSIYSKGQFTANVKPWLDFYGQILYSQPSTDVNYQQSATGSLQNQLLLYSSQQFLLTAAAKLPHTTASAGAEIRPLQRVRIIESWITDRLHNASSAASSQVFVGPPGTSTTAGLLASSLATNYNQEQIDVFFDATAKLVLRGGYRFVWGDANDITLPAAGLASSDQGKLRRNVGLGAITFRPRAKLSLTAEAEVASSSETYFRTSLYDYQKVRAQARYSATATLSLAADVTVLNNDNPSPDVRYNYRMQQASASVFWSPAGGKLGDLQGSYTRATVRSDIGYLTPQDLTPQQSRYRDNAHIATAMFNIKLPDLAHVAPKLTAGGSFVISSGSRPTNYFQPLATLGLPMGKSVSWFAEWRYYGYGEAFYLYEGFRTHLVTAGLRLTR